MQRLWANIKVQTDLNTFLFENLWDRKKDIESLLVVNQTHAFISTLCITLFSQVLYLDWGYHLQNGEMFYNICLQKTLLVPAYYILPQQISNEIVKPFWGKC